MALPPVDARALAQSGADALRRGDARTARASFERIVGAGAADAASYVGLAYACRDLNDAAGVDAALDKALELEPQNLGALMLKADHLAALGDARSAVSFYRHAIRVAPPAAEMPAALRDELARARAMCDRFAGDFEAFLMDRLERHGLPGGPATARFRHSLDLLLGRKQRYFQQPNIYCFPELPQIQFYDRQRFPWLDRVEAATADIRAELASVLAATSPAFVPYVRRVPGRPRRDLAGLEENPSWSAFYLWKDGEVVLDNAARCPKTLDALAEAPQVWVRNRSPSVLFSLLRPGAHIPPHTGLTNTRLICHLPLIVPPDCILRVGNDARAPVEGKAWVFDDTIEHEAWNRSDRTRVILLFEIWRPELSEEERTLVTAMFEAIDAYSGEKPVWSI
ncbi:MAG TPA: aspartyl/asparaginyl beta-hydroxylase domain-containing protein [Casimicrobiaceae bacterium]|nr:aspartyl/asparaginyl beta-hydroxylase domain-containing protein [Casimicrobiaceae bacterium]